MRHLLLALFVSLGAAAFAQPPIVRDLAAGARDEASRRNDVEGGVWEYKVIERAGDKKTVLVGKVRVKQSAAFDVAGSAEGSLLGEAAGGEEEGDFRAPVIGRLKLPKPPRLGVLDRVAESGRGGERIGDVTYHKSRSSTGATAKVVIRFDTDDDHPLSGEANLKLDTRGGAGVWRGAYVEQQTGEDKRRWTMELRFIED